MPTYRSFISPLAVVLAVALVPGMALAQGAVGTWAQNGDPSSCSPRSPGHLKVSTRGIEQGNSKCWFGNDAPKGFASVRGNMECTGGVASIDISAVGNRLTILKNGNHTAYERCAGAVTEPVFDGGYNRRDERRDQREERRAQRRQDEQGQVYRRQAEPRPLTQEEAATQMMIDLLGGALSNGN